MLRSAEGIHTQDCPLVKLADFIIITSNAVSQGEFGVVHVRHDVVLREHGLLTFGILMFTHFIAKNLSARCSLDYCSDR